MNQCCYIYVVPLHCKGAWIWWSIYGCLYSIILFRVDVIVWCYRYASHACLLVNWCCDVHIILAFNYFIEWDFLCLESPFLQFETLFPHPWSLPLYFLPLFLLLFDMLVMWCGEFICSGSLYTFHSQLNWRTSLTPIPGGNHCYHPCPGWDIFDVKCSYYDRLSIPLWLHV